MVRMKTRYRVVIRLKGKVLYANREVERSLPRVRWSTLDTEYPDHFSRGEAEDIADMYSEQGPTIQSVRLDSDQFEEEDADA